MDLKLASGTWPADVRGEMVISAPEPDPRLSYALFGFGAMIRISLQSGSHGAAPDRFALRTNVIDSPSKRLFDRDPTAFRAEAFGWNSPYGAPNAANTAALPWGDRLFATWDVGRPIEIDPLTLGYLGDVGDRASWGNPTFPMGDVLPFYFSSAHPVVDPDRDCLWTVKLMPLPDMSMQLHLVRWDGEGGTMKSWPIANGVVRGSSHTIAQTRDWLILADSGNFKTDLGELAGGPRTATIDEGAAVYLIRKAHLDAAPPGSPFTPQFASVAPTTGHFYGVWDDTDGVRVIFEHMDLMDLGFRLNRSDRDCRGRALRPTYAGLYNMAMAPNSISEVTFDPIAGTSTTTATFQEDWTFNLQLSAIDWSTEGLAAPTYHHVAYQGWHPEAVSERAMSTYRKLGRTPKKLPKRGGRSRLVTLKRDGLSVHSIFEFPSKGDLVSSPTFVPRASGLDSRNSRYAGRDPGGHDGYVVAPVLNDDGFRVELFDAKSVGKGPVATLVAPRGQCLPVLLHSAWMPSVQIATDHERVAFSQDVQPEAIDRLQPEMAATVIDVMTELDNQLAHR